MDTEDRMLLVLIVFLSNLNTFGHGVIVGFGLAIMLDGLHKIYVSSK
jgi:hypothetical protein